MYRFGAINPTAVSTTDGVIAIWSLRFRLMLAIINGTLEAIVLHMQATMPSNAVRARSEKLTSGLIPTPMAMSMSMCEIALVVGVIGLRTFAALGFLVETFFDFTTPLLLVGSLDAPLVGFGLVVLGFGATVLCFDTLVFGAVVFCFDSLGFGVLVVRFDSLGFGAPVARFDSLCFDALVVCLVSLVLCFDPLVLVLTEVGLVS